MTKLTCKLACTKNEEYFNQELDLSTLTHSTLALKLLFLAVLESVGSASE